MIGKPIFYSFLILLFFMLITCDEEDPVTAREYPRVRTLEVTNITKEGATFQAEIFYPGSSPITEYGFVWNRSGNPHLNYADRKTTIGTLKGPAFSADIRSALSNGATYSVRAYVKDGNHLVYGNAVTFKSRGTAGPEIESMEPVEGTLGDTIKLTGNDFSYMSEENNIKFLTYDATVLETGLSDTTLYVLVPVSLRVTTSDVKLSITGRSSYSPDQFTLLPPQIDSLNQDSGNVGDTLLIYGKYFGNRPAHVSVFFGSTEATLIHYDKHQLAVQVPGPPSRTPQLLIKVAHLGNESKKFKIN